VRYPLYAAAVIELGNRMGRVTKPALTNRTTAAMELFSNAKDSILLPQATEWRIEPSAGTETVEDSLLIDKRIWEDRLNVMQRVAPHKDRTISMQIEMFLKMKDHEAGANKISTSRLYALRLHLSGFADWIGGAKSVDKIAGQDLVNYRMHLLQQVANEKLARTTASDRMTSVKGFIRWLWQTEAISELPRVLHPKSKMLEIGKGVKKILTFTESEIATLLTRASNRTKLYVLLALNCGMTQKDISDLRDDEVDWESGCVVRKRSKTRSYANVPCVSYKLWPETFELLLAHRNDAGSERVLLNNRGEPLLTERLGSDGKYWKMDNVRNAYDRVRRKTKLDKPFKCLKKTSASLLRNNERFGSVVSLFLGHAPRDISDRHYAAVPQQLLENGLSWLHGHLNQNGCFAYHRK
jgi:integrase